MERNEKCNGVAAVWFTHRGCEAFLAHSVAAARKSHPGVQVFFFDDARHPSDAYALSKMEPRAIHKTHWPRAQNLNGWPAVDGILEALAQAGEQSSAQHVIKIDCDTMILDARWLDGQAAASGFHQGARAHLLGACYALRCDAIARVREMIGSLPRKGVPDPAEDQCITGHALWMYGQDGVQAWPMDSRHLRWFCGRRDDPEKLDCLAATFHWRIHHSMRDLAGMAAVRAARCF